MTVGRWTLGLVATTLVACSLGSQHHFEDGDPANGGNPPEVLVEAKDLGPESVRAYLAQLAPYLVSRELEEAELAKIDADKADAIVPILTGWTREPGFAEAARRFVGQELSLSGMRDGVNFNLPGNLAAYVAKNNLPLSTILTADYCIGDDGEKTVCDTMAPYNAGVLGTRAYLFGRAGRFNLTRAATMIHAFACRVYPMSPELQPRLERASLIQMFQVDSAEEITDPKAKNEGAAFGNGSACYSCHGQFGAHAQLFVRFDAQGIYRENATGLQDPEGELGRSTDDLYASHLADPAVAGVEKTQMFGKSVQNLREAAVALAQSSTFLPCQVNNLIGYTLGNDVTQPVASDLLDPLVAELTAAGEPTFADVVVATYGHPRIIQTIVQGIGAVSP